MKKTILFFNIIFIWFLSFIFFLSNNALANNLSINNVALKDRDPSIGIAIISFDISWENAWKTKINHDAVWVTIRLHSASAGTQKVLAPITFSGDNPQGTSKGESEQGIDIYVTSDKLGAFISPASYGKCSEISAMNVQLTVNYEEAGFANTDQVYASVLGIEMVYIPEGPFYVGDYSFSQASLNQGSEDIDPWYIYNEESISTDDAANNSYQYVSAGNADEDPTGTSFLIPDEFPKGYKSFYAMKYEITE